MTNKYVPIIGTTRKYNIILLLFYSQCSKTNGSALVAVVLPAAERDHIRIRNHFLHRSSISPLSLLHTELSLGNRVVFAFVKQYGVYG